MSLQVILKLTLHQPFIDCAWSQMVTLLQNTAEHTPETENLRQKKITTSVIRNIGYGPVRGDKHPSMREKNELLCHLRNSYVASHVNFLVGTSTISNVTNLNLNSNQKQTATNPDAHNTHRHTQTHTDTHNKTTSS